MTYHNDVRHLTLFLCGYRRVYLKITGNQVHIVRPSGEAFALKLHRHHFPAPVPAPSRRVDFGAPDERRGGRKRATKGRTTVRRFRKRETLAAGNSL